jgi:hypothetical protein
MRMPETDEDAEEQYVAVYEAEAALILESVCAMDGTRSTTHTALQTIMHASLDGDGAKLADVGEEHGRRVEAKTHARTSLRDKLGGGRRGREDGWRPRWRRAPESSMLIGKELRDGVLKANRSNGRSPTIARGEEVSGGGDGMDRGLGLQGLGLLRLK